jgi:hypothetical protein
MLVTHRCGSEPDRAGMLLLVPEMAALQFFRLLLRATNSQSTLTHFNPRLATEPPVVRLFFSLLDGTHPERLSDEWEEGSTYR